eukprot:CAMPEP_0173115478 /NCGR_PEP_ID=MMETSP1102-20130122/48518_1 /TAXON_ID=49646 /ORGANISM="Geminigera sp., Strain Caron Lab Isolate" /LENGTH=156 /DNA_ID=CAMNT_0014018509 /DNA_START=85 /DNA_END=552 /DNA_ORIENTATION=+
MTASKEVHPQLIHDRTDSADASLSPHPPLVAQDHTASERQRASEHMRATQWAYAHFSMVVESDPWEQDEDNGDGDGWSDWEQSDSSSLDSGTPDWRDQFDKLLGEDSERAKMKREKVSEALGAVTYNSPTGLVVAQQCMDGGILYRGERYTGVAHW